MTKEEIITGNRLIAEFMGYNHDTIEDDDDDISIMYYCYDHLENSSDKEAWETTQIDWTSWLRPDEMKFHSSWDWLMPVVNKCYEIGNLGEPARQEIEESLLGIIDIATTWEAVVEFIKWYNEKYKNDEYSE